MDWIQHVILIRAAYTEATLSRARLALTLQTLVPSLKGQQDRRFTLCVHRAAADPYREEREQAFLSIGVPVTFFAGSAAPPGTDIWLWAIGARRPTALSLATTRIDDDDAFAADAMARLHQKMLAVPADSRIVWSFPEGYRYHAGRIARMTSIPNQFVTLQTPWTQPDQVNRVKHGDIRELAPIRVVDTLPGWLWVRHALARSRGGRTATRLAKTRIKHAFPIPLIRD